MAEQPNSPPYLSESYARAIPTWRAAYSDRTAAMMAAFSQLAYVPFETAEGVQALADHLKTGGFDLKQTFLRNDVQAFLAVNADQFAVLAFRGTANVQDWGINLDVPLTRMTGFAGVKVHTGFWDAFEAMKDPIRQSVDLHVSADLGLYVTGHSLGGALAQIASAVLERDNLAACYTYGSPRVATLNFDRAVRCPHYRVIDKWDLVPGIPPPAPWGYLHSGDPRLLEDDKPLETLRRDRDLVTRTLVYLWSFLVWPLTRKLTVVDDHMIWGYRVRLERIAQARAGAAIAAQEQLGASKVGQISPGSPPPKPRAAKPKAPRA